MPIIDSERRLREINSLYGNIERAWRTTVDDAIRIGGLLTEQKREFKHGQWGKWVARLPFSRATANNFMRLYRHGDKVKSLTVSNLKGALTELSRILAEPDPKPDRVVNFSLSPEECEEFDKLINDLMEKVFRATSIKDAILAALRFTSKHKELVDADDTSDHRAA